MILLYILYLFSETFFLFTSTVFILTSFFFYISFFKAIDKFTTNVFLALGSTDLSFPTQAGNFLLYCMSANFGLYPGYPENDGWILFKYSRKGWHFYLSRQLILFPLSHLFWPDFFELWFQCQSSFQSPACQTPNGESGSHWAAGSGLSCRSALKVFGMLFRVRFMHVVCGEPRGSWKIL